jgi:hypothetical protein
MMASAVVWGWDVVVGAIVVAGGSVSNSDWSCGVLEGCWVLDSVVDIAAVVVIVEDSVVEEDSVVGDSIAAGA